MNFYELPDKDFDEKFRKAAESAGFPFSEEAWSGMEKKLDLWEKFGPAFWRLSGGFILILLGLMVLLIFKTPEAGESLQAGESGNLSGQIAGTGLKESESGNRSGTLGNDGTRSSKELEREKENPAAIIARSGKGFEKVSTETNPDPEWVEDHDDPGQTEPGLNPVVAETGNTGIGNSRENRLMVQYPPVTVLTERNGLPDISGAPALNRPLPENAESVEMPVIPSGKNKSGLGYSVNLMIGPDFSGVGAQSYGTGTFAGLGFEIFIGNRFSLMTGISHARKKYAVSEEYTVPYGGGQPYGQEPVNVDIACHVLDIPVNVYYSLFNKGHNRFFAGVGLSTYLMLTEEYHIEYDGYYGQNPVSDYTVKNENQHYFGIVNLSAGYTRQLGARWALQVEPYLKLPIQDIAAAEVRLNSFGALISLKYRFR